MVRDTDPDFLGDAELVVMATDKEDAKVQYANQQWFGTPEPQWWKWLFVVELQ